MQELAARHADLDSGHAVAQAVAQLVGGKSCRAARGIKHAELVNFLYHGAFKFSRGKTATEVLPQSVADKLRRQKTLGPNTILRQTCIPLYCLAMFLLYNVYLILLCIVFTLSHQGSSRWRRKSLVCREQNFCFWITFERCAIRNPSTLCQGMSSANWLLGIGIGMSGSHSIS